MPKGAEAMMNPDSGKKNRAPATFEAPSIGEVLTDVVKEVNEAFEAARATDEQGAPQARLGAVDIELSFKSVTLSESGWLLFGKDSKESQLEIRLATRIQPPD